MHERHSSIFFCENSQIGEAIAKNPGYLKLKKIRAAQNIARTVSLLILNNYKLCAMHRYGMKLHGDVLVSLAIASMKKAY
jgi:hypothetical protein